MSQAGSQRESDAQDKEEGTARTAIDFRDLPMSATHKYLVQHGLVPEYPPAQQLRDPRAGDAPPSVPDDTPADEPGANENASGGAVRTRSAASQSEAPEAPGHEFFDSSDEHAKLAALATEHYQMQPPPREADVLVAFLHRCRRGGAWMC